MNERIFSAGVYQNRIAVYAPQNLGPVDVSTERVEGGVLIYLRPSPGGKLRGTPGATKTNADAWLYAWRPRHKLPKIGASLTEVRTYSVDGSLIGLFLAEGRQVRTHVVTPKTAPPAASPAALPNPTTRRGEMVREINAWKDELGDALALSITPEGKLRALVEYG